MHSSRTLVAPAPACVALLCLTVAGGCARTHQTAFVDTMANFDAVRRVAVLPFENMTRDENAGEKVRRIFSIELLAQRVVEVVDPGEVARALREKRIGSPATLGPPELAALGEELRVDALIFGAVEEYGMDRGRQVQSVEVALSFRMLDVKTGATLWSASASRGGAGAMSRLFGTSGDSVTEATRKLVRKALSSMIE